MALKDGITILIVKNTNNNWELKCGGMMFQDDKDEIIKLFLTHFNVESIYDLPDKVLVDLFDCITDDIVRCYGGASQIYKESNKKERKKLVEDVKKCIEGNAEISYILLYREPAEPKDEADEEYNKWISRHSVDYEITPIP